MKSWQTSIIIFNYMVNLFENFMTLVDLQILVKDCANTRYNTNTRYKYNLKSLLNNLLNINGEWGASNCIFWNFSPPKAFYYDPPKLRNFRESSIPLPPFNYHPLILWNFLVKLSSAKWKSWVKTKWENYSEDKQS